MQQFKVLLSKVIILICLFVALSGIILVDGTEAGGAPLMVSLQLPGAVNFAVPFDIPITVINQTGNAVTINKVAVAMGYTQQLLKFRGPYEVNFTPQDVPPHGTKKFIVPFRIIDGQGTVVSLAVILSNGNYTKEGIIGSAFGGVKVN